jgi:Ca-activated chloride channel family protein
VYPRELPDLFYGTQLTVFGRYKKAGQSAIRLTGQVAGKPVDFTYEKALPDSDTNNEFIEKLWGTRKIAYLLDQIRKSGESSEVKDEVVRLAKKYGVVTPYTSYLVQEDTQPVPVVAAATPVDHQRFMPRQAPVLMDAEKKVGVAGPTGSIRASAAPSAGGAADQMSYRRSYNLAASSGAEAVDAAKDLRKMKEASSVSEADEVSQAQRAVAGLRFRLLGETWVDTQLSDSEPATLKIKYLSDAYFEALRQNPELKDVFSLGTQVRVKLSKCVLEIGSEGVEKLSTEQIELLKK